MQRISCEDGVLYDPRLPQFTERHHFRLPPIQLAEIFGRAAHRRTTRRGLSSASGADCRLQRSLALARYALRLPEISLPLLAH